MGMRRIRVLAIHLPQFHPIPENDAWWGPGFTEWTNVVRAKPLFAGHQQPRMPADLGFYDLRLPEARQAQATLASEHGIEGFCYYHYWFHGRRLLERPVHDILATRKPDFPFCLFWANETWSRRWLGEDQDILIEQTYSKEDNKAHARFLVSVFQDPRSIRVAGRPLFIVYRPTHMAFLADFIAELRAQSRDAGTGDPFLLGCSAHAEATDMRSMGFDGTLDFQPKLGFLPGAFDDAPSRERRLRNLEHGVDSERLRLYETGALRKEMSRFRDSLSYPVFPSVFVSWDNTPRRNEDGIILSPRSTESFAEGIHDAMGYLSRRQDQLEEPLLFVNAWNEWAEGNYLEPDVHDQKSFLTMLRATLAGPGHLPAIVPSPAGSSSDRPLEEPPRADQQPADSCQLESRGSDAAMTDRDFITFCYQRILGREADASGLEQYLGALRDLRMSRQQILMEFVESPECRQGLATARLPLTGHAQPTEFVPPGHYYSAIPSEADRRRASAVRLAKPVELQGIELGVERQWALLEELRPLLESGGLADEPTGGRRYGFTNPSFGPGDALVLQAIMRHFRPRRIVEVGSGHTSALMLDVDEFQLGRSVEFTFLEPHPDLLKSLMKPGDPTWAIRRQILQEVDLDLFRGLAANDILFIDSTHVLKAGSDVCRLLFEVLPVLTPGVLIHIHDIFWPFEYPSTWLDEGRAWNEAYALRAFLQYNRCFSILLFANYLAQRDRGWFERHAPTLLRNVGGSIWIRRDA